MPYEFRMRFNGNSPRIDCKTRFEIHGEHIGKIGEKAGLKKSLTVNGHMHEGKLCFNMNLCLDKSRKAVRDLPYSISEWSGDVRKTEDYWYKEDLIIIDTPVSKEESFNSTTYVNGIYWFCLRDSEKGLAVMNRGCMGSAVSGNRVSLPLVYSNEYMCGTVMLDGVYEDEFALLPFESELSDAQLHKKAVSYAYMPVVKKLQSGVGENNEFTFAELKSDNDAVVMTTMYPENGNILVRFCNYSDSSAECEFVPAKGKICAEVDLLGNELSEVTDGKFRMRPWEIKTLKIELL